MSARKAPSFHEQAIVMLTEAWHKADDKAKLWEGERARLAIEIEKEIARGQAQEGEKK